MNDTSITVKDLFKVLKYLESVMIIIDGKVEWMDDIELSADKNEAFKQCWENQMKYFQLIDSNKLIDSFHVRIVDFHHSIVHINLKK